MSDLISRSALIKRIRRHKEVVRSGNKEIDSYYGIAHKHIIELVEEMPTAYNLDAVVEELEKQWNNAICIDDDMFYLGIANGLADAIDIVRKGGANI